MSIETYKEWMDQEIKAAEWDVERCKEKITEKIPITSYAIQKYVVASTRLETLKEVMLLLAKSERQIGSKKFYTDEI